MGEAIGSLSFKELKNLEGRLEKAIGRVRSKKVHSLWNPSLTDITDNHRAWSYTQNCDFLGFLSKKPPMFLLTSFLLSYM